MGRKRILHRYLNKTGFYQRFVTAVESSDIVVAHPLIYPDAHGLKQPADFSYEDQKKLEPILAFFENELFRKKLFVPETAGWREMLIEQVHVATLAIIKRGHTGYTDRVIQTCLHSKPKAISLARQHLSVPYHLDLLAKSTPGKKFELSEFLKYALALSFSDGDSCITYFTGSVDVDPLLHFLRAFYSTVHEGRQIFERLGEPRFRIVDAKTMEMSTVYRSKDPVPTSARFKELAGHVLDALLDSSSGKKYKARVTQLKPRNATHEALYDKRCSAFDIGETNPDDVDPISIDDVVVSPFDVVPPTLAPDELSFGQIKKAIDNVDKDQETLEQRKISDAAKFLGL